jgi:hypothetical protein
MHAQTKLALVTLITATQAIGCYMTWDIAPARLVHLNGFREGRTIRWEADEDHTFTSETELHFRGTDGVALSARFRRIDVQHGVLVGEVEKTGAPVRVDLSRLASVQARRLAVGQTVLMVVGTMLVVVPVAALVNMVVVVSHL